MTETPQSHDKTKRIQRAGAVAVGVLFFFVYFFTASHTVVLEYDDAAEFQTIAVVGGLPHQPYPLWCVIARAFALLPLGEPALRATLMTIVAASLTLALMFAYLFGRTKSLLIAFGATAALGLSYTFWQDAVFVDVYALNGLLFVLVAWAAVRFHREPSARRWLLFVLALGFLIVNHTTNAAVLPAALVLLLWSGARWFRGAEIRLLLASAALFVLPFTLYLYTYLIDSGPYPMNWIDQYGQYVYMDRGGNPADLRSFVGRMDFQMFSTRSTPSYSLSGWLHKMYTWFRLTGVWEFPYLGAFLALIGFAILWVKDRKIAVLATMVTIPYVILAIYVFEGAGMQRWSNAVYILFVLYLGEALIAVRSVARKLRLPGTPVVLVLVVAMLLIPLWRYSALPQNGRWTSRFVNLQGANDRGKAFGERMSELLPPHSLVFCRWSQTHTLFYYQYVKGRLRGVELHHLLPRVEYMRQIIEREAPETLYFTFPPEPLGFQVEEVTPVIRGMELYKVSLGDQ